MTRAQTSNARPHPSATWTKGNHGVGHIDAHGDVVTMNVPEALTQDHARWLAPHDAYAHFLITPGGHVDANMTGPMSTTEFYRLVQQAHWNMAPKWTRSDELPRYAADEEMPDESDWSEMQDQMGEAMRSRGMHEPDWAPLEAVMPKPYLGDWMFMGYNDGVREYKHYDTRRYLHLLPREDARTHPTWGSWLPENRPDIHPDARFNDSYGEQLPILAIVPHGYKNPHSAVPNQPCLRPIRTAIDYAYEGIDQLGGTHPFEDPPDTPRPVTSAVPDPRLFECAYQALFSGHTLLDPMSAQQMARQVIVEYHQRFGQYPHIDDVMDAMKLAWQSYHGNPGASPSGPGQFEDDTAAWHPVEDMHDPDPVYFTDRIQPAPEGLGPMRFGSMRLGSMRHLYHVAPSHAREAIQRHGLLSTNIVGAKPFGAFVNDPRNPDGPPLNLDDQVWTWDNPRSAWDYATPGEDIWRIDARGTDWHKQPITFATARGKGVFVPGRVNPSRLTLQHPDFSEQDTVAQPPAWAQDSPRPSGWDHFGPPEGWDPYGQQAYDRPVSASHDPGFDEFVAQYIETAVWSSLDDEGRPLDSHDAEVAPDARASLRRDCQRFWDEAQKIEGFHDIDSGQAGHDFWLTRNGHGAGFWDRGLGELGDKLTDLAKGFGEEDLWLGPDRQIHTHDSEPMVCGGTGNHEGQPIESCDECEDGLEMQATGIQCPECYSDSTVSNVDQHGEVSNHNCLNCGHDWYDADQWQDHLHDQSEAFKEQPAHQQWAETHLPGYTGEEPEPTPEWTEHQTRFSPGDRLLHQQHREGENEGESIPHGEPYPVIYKRPDANYNGAHWVHNPATNSTEWVFGDHLTPMGDWHDLPTTEPPPGHTGSRMSEYRGIHTAPGPEFGAPLHALDQVFPEDIYTSPHHYFYDLDHDADSYYKIAPKRGNPDARVGIYRAGPVGELNAGDWVTPNAAYAKQHSRHPTDPAQDMPVWKYLVPASSLWNDGNSLSEFGFHGPTLAGSMRWKNNGRGWQYLARPTNSPEANDWLREWNLRRQQQRQGGTKMADGPYGYTNWHTSSVILALDNDRRLHERSRELVRRGVSPDQFRDWVIRAWIAPHNKQQLADAQDWNEIPEEERLDHNYEAFKDKHGDDPKAMDMLHGLVGGPDVGDTTADLVDAELVNWQEVMDEIKSEFEEQDEYERAEAEANKRWTFSNPGNPDEMNHMYDAWMKHHGAQDDMHMTLTPIDQLDPDEFSGGTEGDFWKNNIIPKGGFNQLTRTVGWEAANKVRNGTASPDTVATMQQALAGQGHAPEAIQSIMQPKWKWDKEQNTFVPINQEPEPPPRPDRSLDAPGDLTLPEHWSNELPFEGREDNLCPRCEAGHVYNLDHKLFGDAHWGCDTCGYTLGKDSPENAPLMYSPLDKNRGMIEGLHAPWMRHEPGSKDEGKAWGNPSVNERRPMMRAVENQELGRFPGFLPPDYPIRHGTVADEELAPHALELLHLLREHDPRTQIPSEPSDPGHVDDEVEPIASPDPLPGALSASVRPTLAAPFMELLGSQKGSNGPDWTPEGWDAPEPYSDHGDRCPMCKNHRLEALTPDHMQIHCPECGWVGERFTDLDAWPTQE